MAIHATSTCRMTVEEFAEKLRNLSAFQFNRLIDLLGEEQLPPPAAVLIHRDSRIDKAETEGGPR